MKFGCIGERLKHSFSKEIHAKLADYKYELIELSEDEVEPFLRERDFDGLNVTIPYKQAVIPFLDSISDIAERIGAVNTIVNKIIKQYETDCYEHRPYGDRILLLLRLASRMGSNWLSRFLAVQERGRRKHCFLCGLRKGRRRGIPVLP